MVSLEQRDSLLLSLEDDPELREIYAFLFAKPAGAVAENASVHLRILRCLAKPDEQAFRCELSDLEGRRITPESDWCLNDCLVFFLLLGCKKFAVEAKRLGEILAIRDRNLNPEPQKVNDIFKAIERDEYGMVGEYCFLKIPFLCLLGQLDLKNEEARRAYEELGTPGVFQRLTPFLQLLALRAHDLILFERKPTSFENFDQIVEVIERDHKSLNLRQVGRLIAATSLKGWMVIGAIAFPLIVAIFGFGYRLGQNWIEMDRPRERPNALGIVSCVDVGTTQNASLTEVAGAMQAQHKVVDAKDKFVVFVIQCTSFERMTPAFTVELSHASHPIVAVDAFLHNSGDSQEEIMFIATQRRDGIFRALVPKAGQGGELIFLALVEVPTNNDKAVLQSGFLVRSLE